MNKKKLHEEEWPLVPEHLVKFNYNYDMVVNHSNIRELAEWIHVLFPWGTKRFLSFLI